MEYKVRERVGMKDIDNGRHINVGNDNVNVLLQITESAVRALNKVPDLQDSIFIGATLDSPNVEYLGNESETLDSEDSKSTSAGSVLIRSTNMLQSGAFRGRDNMKPVKIPAKNLKEVKVPLKARVVGVERVVTSDGGFVVLEKSTVSSQRVGSDAKLKTQKNLHNKFTVDQNTDSFSSEICNPRSDFGKSKNQVISVERNADKSSKGSGRGCFDNIKSKKEASAEGKEIRAALDSGYLTQKIQSIKASEITELSASSQSSRAELDLSSGDSYKSPIIVCAKDQSSSESCCTQPEIFTVEEKLVNVRAPATSTATSTAASTCSSDEGNVNDYKPFLALKDRFLKYHSVVLKQGTLTSESSGADDMAQKSAQSDDLHIEQFSLDDRQKKLRQEFVSRSDRHQSKTAVKKVVPAKIVASLPEAANSRQVEPVASSLAPDTVASAAVAAVVATQTFMKSQQDLESKVAEILEKMSRLQSKQDSAPAPFQQFNATRMEDQDRRKLEALEGQLAALTNRRLEHLENAQQRQLDIQAQMLELARQPQLPHPSYHHQRYHTHDATTSSFGQPEHDGHAVRFSKSESSLTQDIEHEKAAVLETPAPRKKPPQPMPCQPVSLTPKNNVSNGLLKKILASENESSPGESSVGLARYETNFVDKNQNSESTMQPPGFQTFNPSSRATQSADIVRDIPLTPDRPISKAAPAPIDKYLAKPLPDANVSPYPMLKGLRSSHMPALVQYAEAEAVLKRVDASSAFLEANLEAIMNAQNEVDIGFLLSGSNPDRSVIDRSRIKRLIDERMKIVNKTLESEVGRELMKIQEENELKAMVPERDKPFTANKKPSRFAGPSSTSYAISTKTKVADKENIPKNIKAKKAVQLDPVKDEESLRRIYGKALYHKQRNAQKDSDHRYAGSPKSKLARTSVHIPHAKVKGVEMATAKTQTSVSGRAMPEGNFVRGLHGQLIPIAIPLALPRQDWLSPQPRSGSRSPAKPTDVSYKKIVVKEHDREIPDDNIRVVEEEEEEEEETMTEEMEAISLPGHTSPPVEYHGPEFLVRIPTMQPEPSSDVLAEDIHRADVLQRQAVDWVEQELMARIISEMHRVQFKDELSHVNISSRQKEELPRRVNESGDDFSVNSELSVDDSMIADAIGSGGVQLFVDAGRPIDETLVKALVKEVLMEKIAAMLSDGGSIERIPGPTAPIVRQQSPTLDMVVDMPIFRSVSTPLPTPVHSPVRSEASPPRTPIITPSASVAEVIPKITQLTSVKDEGDSDDEGEFPSYKGGLSDSESEKRAAESEKFEMRHDVRTPSLTPSASPLPVRTPSPSIAELPPEIKVVRPRTPVTELPPSHPLEMQVEHVDISTSPLVPEEPPEVSVAQSREESSSHSETESFAPPTETSITNNDCVSEGQWIISILSEGEVPHMKVDEALHERIRRHLINGSRTARRSVDEDTFGIMDDLDQDIPGDPFPSEGEVCSPPGRMADHEVILDLLAPPQSGIPTSMHRRVDRSLGEVSLPNNSRLSFGERPFGRTNRTSKTASNLRNSRHSSSDSSVGNAYSIGEYRSVPVSTRMKTELQGSSRRLQQAETTSPSDGYQIRETHSLAAERQESRESTSNKKVSRETISPTDQRQAAKPLSPTEKPQTTTEAASELRPSSSRGSVSGGARARPAQGLVMSTLDNSGRGGPRGYQPSFSGSKSGFGPSIRRSISPQRTFSPMSDIRQSFDAGMATLTRSDLDGQTMTSDQMNMDSLIQSRDYFNETDYGSTGGMSRKVPADDPFRSTYQLQRSEDFDPADSTQGSLGQQRLGQSADFLDSNQYERFEDSLDRNLGAGDEGESRDHANKFQMSVKIPTVGSFEDFGSDESDEHSCSEISLGEQK